MRIRGLIEEVRGLIEDPRGLIEDGRVRKGLLLHRRRSIRHRRRRRRTATSEAAFGAFGMLEFKPTRGHNLRNIDSRKLWA